MIRPASILIAFAWTLGCQGAPDKPADRPAAGQEAAGEARARHDPEPREGGLAERGQATAGPENRGVFSEQGNLGQHDVDEQRGELPVGQSKENPGKTATADSGGTKPAAAEPAPEKQGEAAPAKAEPKK